MDPSEALVELYLRHLGFDDIVYEPDGNIPPDFAVDRRIAVEVRRLNEHLNLPSAPEALDRLQIPTRRRFDELLKEFGPPNRGTSWFVTYRLRRPLEPWRSLRSQVARWLDAFKEGPQEKQTHSQRFDGGVKLWLVPSASELEDLFVLGGFVDSDASGWLLSDLRENLDFCIAEKTRKAAPFWSRYPEWWLVFVDHIGYGLTSYQREIFGASLPAIGAWSRVILLNPSNHTSAFVMSSEPSR
jgi:hypothetical protein